MYNNIHKPQILKIILKQILDNKYYLYTKYFKYIMYNYITKFIIEILLKIKILT